MEEGPRRPGLRVEACPLNTLQMGLPGLEKHTKQNRASS